MSYDNLQSFYQTCFYLVTHAKFKLSDVENMMPFERQVYVSLLMQHLEQVKQQNEAAAKQR